MKLLTGLRRSPTVSVYVPSLHGTPDYQERLDLVSRVEVDAGGPDSSLKIISRGEVGAVGRLYVLSVDVPAWLDRLFRPMPTRDSERVQRLMDDLQEATVSGDFHAVRLARRQLLAAYEAMAADLAASGGGRA